MKKATDNIPYALVRPRHDHGYGHLDLTVFGLFPGMYNSPSFVIRSQTGGRDMKNFMYGWKYGIETSFDPLGASTLKTALTVMRRIESALRRQDEKGQRRETYPDYVLAILHASRVRNVHFVPGINGGWSGPDTDLPMIDCFKDPLGFTDKLHDITKALYARC